MLSENIARSKLWLSTFKCSQKWKENNKKYFKVTKRKKMKLDFFSFYQYILRCNLSWQYVDPSHELLLGCIVSLPSTVRKLLCALWDLTLVILFWEQWPAVFRDFVLSNKPWQCLTTIYVARIQTRVDCMQSSSLWAQIRSSPGALLGLTPSVRETKDILPQSKSHIIVSYQTFS